MNIIVQKLSQQQMKTNIPYFRSGDLISVKLLIIDGNKQRFQFFEGIVISVRNSGLNTSFTLRRVISNEGVERMFKLHSPMIVDLIIKRRGLVHKSKLYYLRGRLGKSARIKERLKR